jgi:hypothetical protein
MHKKFCPLAEKCINGSLPFYGAKHNNKNNQRTEYATITATLSLHCDVPRTDFLLLFGELLPKTNKSSYATVPDVEALQNNCKIIAANLYSIKLTQCAKTNFSHFTGHCTKTDHCGRHDNHYGVTSLCCDIQSVGHFIIVAVGMRIDFCIPHCSWCSVTADAVESDVSKSQLTITDAMW